MRSLANFFALSALSLSASAAPVVVAELDSPSKILKVSLSIDNGYLSYQLDRRGQSVLAPSRLGMVFQNAERIERNLRFVSATTRAFSERWEQPWGEQRWINNRYTELDAKFAEASRGKRVFHVKFRIYDDGIGFRYEFPAQANFKEARIVEELTEFDVSARVPSSASSVSQINAASSLAMSQSRNTDSAAPAIAWWIPAGEWNRYEYLYNTTPLKEVGQAHTPITVKTSDGLYLAIHEAALVDYASMWVRRVDGLKLKAQLSNSAGVARVVKKLPFHTPWRTVQIGDRAGDLVENYLILNLNEPNALGDVSWVKPFKYVGIWWGMHLDVQSWGSGPTHGATTANAKAVIDFAAEHGFRGVLVEGWNQGWDGDWFANGWQFDFLKSTPDFDLSAIAAYGLKKGVHLVGHHETACAVSHYERQMDAAFKLYQKHGVDSVKTGYVCDAGQIEIQAKAKMPVLREWHDGQWMSNHHLRVVKAAAAHHIAINAHEPIKDTGLRRTYPNWVAREGARGMEYNAWGNPPNPPEHEANLVFTRMLSGPMDFTPGVLSLKGRGGQAILSTLAKQLALYVVLYSPIQMAADLPEHYQPSMDAFQFIKDVPVDWETTRVLAGEPGDYAVIARKDRASANWFVGAVSDEHPRSVQVSFDFLEPGKRYQLTLYRDADDAHYLHKPGSYLIETHEISSTDKRSVFIAAGGGFAMSLRAL